MEMLKKRVRLQAPAYALNLRWVGQTSGREGGALGRAEQRGYRGRKSLGCGHWVWLLLTSALDLRGLIK